MRWPDLSTVEGIIAACTKVHDSGYTSQSGVSADVCTCPTAQCRDLDFVYTVGRKHLCVAPEKFVPATYVNECPSRQTSSHPAAKRGGQKRPKGDPSSPAISLGTDAEIRAWLVGAMTWCASSSPSADVRIVADIYLHDRDDGWEAISCDRMTGIMAFGNQMLDRAIKEEPWERTSTRR